MRALSPQFAIRVKRNLRVPYLQACDYIPDMDVKTVRRNNLAVLEKACGTIAALSERTGIPASYISQVKGGYRKLGDAAARKVEAAYRKPVGWMDQPIGQSPENPPVHVGNEISATPNIGLSVSLLNDPAVASLVQLFLQMSKGNQHRTLLECQLRVLDDQPQSADPFAATGLINLLREGSDVSDGTAVPPAQESGGNKSVRSFIKSRKK